MDEEDVGELVMTSAGMSVKDWADCGRIAGKRIYPEETRKQHVASRKLET